MMVDRRAVTFAVLPLAPPRRAWGLQTQAARHLSRRRGSRTIVPWSGSDRLSPRRCRFCRPRAVSHQRSSEFASLRRGRGLKRSSVRRGRVDLAGPASLAASRQPRYRTRRKQGKEAGTPSVRCIRVRRITASRIERLVVCLSSETLSVSQKSGRGCPRCHCRASRRPFSRWVPPVSRHRRTRWRRGMSGSTCRAGRRR